MRAPSVERVIAFEERWDSRMGGPQTRGLREVLVYCSARLVSLGATLEEVLTYLREIDAEFGQGVHKPKADA